MIDSITKKGAYHKVMPQDYAVAKVIYGMPFIAVADGCSAGEHSEIGAMLVCKAAEAVISSTLPKDIIENPETVFKLILDKLDQAKMILGLTFDEMIATLRVAYVLGNTLHTIETGDGFTLNITSPDKYEVTEYNYRINAPYYAAYDLFGFTDSYKNIGPNNLISSLITEKGYSPTTVVENADKRFFRSIPLAELEKTTYFGFATDGLSSYVNDTEGKMASSAFVINELTKIKQPGGMFLGRRFQKLDRELISQGYENKDDIGIALISLDQYRKAQDENSNM